jgi:DNA-binding NtrC family response regulator
MGIFRTLRAAFTGQRKGHSSVPTPEAPQEYAATEAVSLEGRLTPREILFVESAPAILEQLEACLADLEPAWSCRIATDSEDGLKWLAESRFDGVAAPISLSDMSGVEFLRRAAEVAPGTVGMLRASLEDRMQFSRKAGLAPHFLPHSCKPEELGDSLQRTFQLMG